MQIKPGILSYLEERELNNPHVQELLEREFQPVPVAWVLLLLGVGFVAFELGRISGR